MFAGEINEFRQFAQGYSLGLVAFQQRHWEVHIIQLVQYLVEILVAFRPITVRFAEQDVEHNRARFLPRDALQQLAMYRARPWPAARSILHLGKTGFVDHNVRIWAELLCDLPHKIIADAIVECTEQVQPGTIEHNQQ